VRRASALGSLNAYRGFGATDAASKARAVASMAAWRADPTVQEALRETDVARDRADRRRPVIYARRLVASSAILILCALGLLFGVSRLRRGSVRSGGLLLIAALALVPLVAPLFVEDNFSLTGVNVPLLAMFHGSPQQTGGSSTYPWPPVPAPAGEVWTHGSIDASRPTFKGVPAPYAYGLDVGYPTPESPGPSRLFYAAMAACLGVLASVALRRRPQAELTTNPPTVIAAA
jgi:hypothetical protein